MLTWTVAFRTGGTENCEWEKTVSFLLKSDALEAKEAIEKGGRKALLFDTKQLNDIGLPVGWDAKDRGWEWFDPPPIKVDVAAKKNLGWLGIDFAKVGPHITLEDPLKPWTMKEDK